MCIFEMKNTFFFHPSVVFSRNSSCCHVNSARVSVRISLSYEHTNMLIDALPVLSGVWTGFLNMDFFKKQTGKEKKNWANTETMTALTLSEHLGSLMASLVFNCVAFAIEMHISFLTSPSVFHLCRNLLWFYFGKKHC